MTPVRKTLLALLAVGCVACASTVQQTWKSPDDPAMVWNIEGEQSALGEITVTINGETVIHGEVSMKDGTGEFAGDYQGHAVTLACRRGGSSKVRSRCVMSKGEERVAVLIFKSI